MGDSAPDPRPPTPEPQTPGHITQLWSADGSAPTRQRTSVDVWWSRSGLGLRFECEDDDPWASLTGHDEPLWREEVVEVFLAPGLETPKSYFEIELNPLGAVFDARVSSPHGNRREMRVETSWHCGGLESAVTRSADGWRAELFVPWADLGIDTAPPVHWRANFYRIDRPRDGRPVELGCWSPTLTDPGDFHRPARFGVLELAGRAFDRLDSQQLADAADSGVAGVPVLVVPQRSS